MQGMVELGEEVFHMPVRLGLPSYAGGLSEVIRNPRYSTGVGLLMAGLTQHQRQQIEKMQGGSIKHMVERMRRWFETNF
jgi:cell division protein FtsA